MRRGAAGLAGLLALACSGDHQGPGTVTEVRVPDAVVAERHARQRGAESPGSSGKQILFGDLHVHTTFSPDAFILAMPVMGGEGAHPPADACDFARFCSGLDFWSINDHAEGITPRRWAETRESIRACNAVAGGGADPDLVAFLGWEWTQVGATSEAHWGHKNVVLRDTEEGAVPRRPVAAPREQLGRSPIGRVAQLGLALLDWENRRFYRDIPRYYQEIADTPLCPEGVDTRELPEDCLEVAPRPAELFEKLDQWGFPALVIPHGNTWGMSTPAGVSFDKQLSAEQHDPDRQILFELYSGHGNAEELRPWQHVERDASGALSCPAPTPDFEPCCWRAGEIIRSRCPDPTAAECEAAVLQARQDYVEAGITGHWTVPGAQVEDWLECGQCTDCFNPAFNHRPRASAQYALALSSDEGRREGEPLRFRFGLIGSSDNHDGRPGTGYKEFARHAMTEAGGPLDPHALRFAGGDTREPAPRSIPFDPQKTKLGLNQLRHMERQASFFMTGGLVAAHSPGRGRQSVWDALQRREVYATSGDRILLWFDLLHPDGSRSSMGSEVALGEAPRFEVRAAGALEQQPGCPEHAVAALGADGIERLCRGECHHPGDRRRRITRIEVVRILPRIAPDEPIAPLVRDPWRRFDCPDDPSGCRVAFSDLELPGLDREALYYVRAIQEPTPAVNAGGVRCTRDAEGRCTSVDICYGDARTPPEDDCLSPNEERAWSSPIFLRPG